MNFAPLWGGTNETGLFTATEAGEFIITASQVRVSAGAVVTVEDPICDAAYWNRRVLCIEGYTVIYKNHT